MVKLADLKPGDVIRVSGHMPNVNRGKHVVHGIGEDLYIFSEEGRHTLRKGKIDKNGDIAGVELVDDWPSAHKSPTETANSKRKGR